MTFVRQNTKNTVRFFIYQKWVKEIGCLNFSFSLEISEDAELIFKNKGSAGIKITNMFFIYLANIYIYMNHINEKHLLPSWLGL